MNFCKKTNSLTNVNWALTGIKFSFEFSYLLRWFFESTFTSIQLLLLSFCVFRLFSAFLSSLSFCWEFFKIDFSFPTTFIIVSMCFEPALSLFSVVSFFVEMIFKVIFSFPTTFVNSALQLERKFKKKTEKVLSRNKQSV